ncbi:MAG: hypothetical protein R3296_04675 [Oleiphilaceae bacterium]|nr:hypothetical protein [Oleiphilaceae bacterium]
MLIQPRTFSEALGLWLGGTVAPAFGAAARLTGKRPVHGKNGVVFGAMVRPARERGKNKAFEKLTQRLSGEAIVRFSSAIWRDESSLPDVLGMTLRFQPKPTLGAGCDTQDLITFTSRNLATLPLDLLLTNPNDFLDNVYHGGGPFEVHGHRNIWLRIVPRSMEDEDEDHGNDDSGDRQHWLQEKEPRDKESVEKVAGKKSEKTPSKDAKGQYGDTDPRDRKVSRSKRLDKEHGDHDADQDYEVKAYHDKDKDYPDDSHYGHDGGHYGHGGKKHDPRDYSEYAYGTLKDDAGDCPMESGPYPEYPSDKEDSKPWYEPDDWVYGKKPEKSDPYPKYGRDEDDEDDDGKGRSRLEKLHLAVKQGKARFCLEFACPGQKDRWIPIVEIQLVGLLKVNDRALMFSPFHTGKGIRPQGLVQHARHLPYVFSHFGRGALKEDLKLSGKDKKRMEKERDRRRVRHDLQLPQEVVAALEDITGTGFAHGVDLIGDLFGRKRKEEEEVEKRKKAHGKYPREMKKYPGDMKKHPEEKPDMEKDD